MKISHLCISSISVWIEILRREMCRCFICLYLLILNYSVFTFFRLSDSLQSRSSQLLSAPPPPPTSPSRWIWFQGKPDQAWGGEGWGGREASVLRTLLALQTHISHLRPLLSLTAPPPAPSTSKSCPPGGCPCNTSTAGRSSQCPGSGTSGPALYIPRLCSYWPMGDSLIRSWPSCRHHIPYFIFQGCSYG